MRLKKILPILLILSILMPVSAMAQAIIYGQYTASVGVDGTVSRPAYSFLLDPNTGWYRIGADNLGLALGGVKVWDITKPTSTFYQSKTSDGSAVGLSVYAENTAAGGNNDTWGAYSAQGEYSFVADVLRDFIGYHALNTVVSAGTLTNQYGLYVDNLTSATNNYAIYTAGGDITHILKAGQNLLIDGRTTAHTDNEGIIKVILTSATTNNRALDLDSIFTNTIGINSYGILNTVAHHTVITGTNQVTYGNYTGVTKDGADTSVDTHTIYGEYVTATNTGSTNVGTKNTYAGWFAANGDTAGTSTAYGIYAQATGADTNWAGYFSGNVYVDGTVTATGEIVSPKYETIYIPASSLTPTATNGASFGTKEFATNDINMDFYAFDTTTEEYAEFQTPMPEGWDRGTIKAKFYWVPVDDTGDTSKTVEWEIACGALGNGDTIDSALGTSQVISDTELTGESATMHLTGATPAITVGGTPLLGDMIHCKVSRNVGGTDDYAADALLLGIWIQYKSTLAVAAW